MDEASNTLANVSVGCAIALCVLYMMSMCLGVVPIVGLLTLLLYPVLLLIALVGLGTGIMGFQHAARSPNDVGKGPAVIGAAVCGMWLLFQALVMALTTLMVGFVVVVELLA